MQTPVTVLQGVIEAAVARGEIPHQNAQVATAMVLGIVLQVAVFKVYGRIDRTLGAFAAHPTESCWRPPGGGASPTLIISPQAPQSGPYPGHTTEGPHDGR